MGFFDQIASLFSRNGRDDHRLRKGMNHAHAQRPAQAIAVYDSLLECESTSATVRARALFNRALAHSLMKDDQKAIADLQEVLSMRAAPENVQMAARNQLSRVYNRVQRGRDRAEEQA